MPTTAVKVEVEFVAGTWTDVTPDMDFQTGVSVRVGRTSPQQAPQVSSLSFSLLNPTGKYTPGLQVLSDGTAAPYFPNVLPRKRVRYSTTQGVRFLGYVQSWSPTLDNGATGRCMVQAVDRFDQLSRVALPSPFPQEVLADAPIAYWPLTDASGGDGTAAEMSGNGVGSMVPGGDQTTSPQPAFGSPGMPGMGGTAVTFIGTSNAILTSYPIQSKSVGKTIEVWVRSRDQTPSKSQPAVVWRGSDRQQGNEEWLGTAGGTPGGNATYDPIRFTSTEIADGSWHQMVVVYDSPAVGQVQFYLDGALAYTAAAVLDGIAIDNIFVGGYIPSGAIGWQTWNGVIGPVTVYRQSLTAARISTHYKAGFAWFGETVDTRLARLLGYAGLTSTDWNLDTSNVALSGYDPAGKDVVTACQETAASEGGASALYVLAGAVRFTNRYYRTALTPALTVSADLAVSRDNFQPAIDSQSLVNQVTVDRATTSGVQNSFTVADAPSIALYGLYTGTSVTTYTKTDGDALALAQSIVAADRNPSFRMPQVMVDLLTASTDLYTQLQSVQIGSRLRVTSIPTAAAPASQTDLIVEGWTENANINAFTVTFDTSPADNPRAGVFDSTAARFACDGQTLNSSLTNTATTVVIATAAGKPTFTTAAVYPMTIVIGAEHIQLNNAPGGSTSPQTFTGVTRGVDGTTQAAQASGATVQLANAVTFSL